MANLAQLGHLSAALAEQVGRIDEDELARAKLSDRPEDQLRIAGTHLSTLSEDLANAIADAHRYWIAMEHAHIHTSSEYAGHLAWHARRNVGRSNGVPKTSRDGPVPPLR